MIDGLIKLTAKRIYTPALNAALGRGDDATAQDIVNQILHSCEYLFDEYVHDNRLDEVIGAAPQCSTEAIRRGLYAAIVGVPVKPHMLHAILPYSELSTRHYAIEIACERDCSIAVDILYPLCDIPRVVKNLSHRSYQRQRCLFWATALQQRMDAETLRETLTAQLPSLPESLQRKI